LSEWKQKYTLRHPEQDVCIGEFEPVIGSAFLDALCKAYYRRGENIQSIGAFHTKTKSIRLFHEHINNSQPLLLAEIKAGNPDNGFGNKQSWLIYMMTFRSYVESLGVGPSVKSKHISGMNFWLINLMGNGHIPRFPLLTVFKSPKKVSNSLLDYTYKKEDLSSIGFDIADKEELQELDRMLLSIQQDLGDVIQDKLPQQAAIVLKKRLSKIRAEAEAQFEQAVKKRIFGIKAIRMHRKLLSLMDDFLGWRRSEGNSTNPFKNNIQSLSDEKWWGVVLAWCWYRNKGLEPKFGITDTRIYNLIRKEFQRRSDFRSDIAIAEAIGCSKSIIGPSMVLLIHDLCANVDSVRKMPLYADKCDGLGVTEIHWVKPRGAGVLSLLDDNSSLISPSKVVRVIRRATRHYRKICNDDHKANLFLHHHSSKGSSKLHKSDIVKPMTPSQSTNLGVIKKIIQAASGGAWSGTAKSIRISILLYRGLTGGLIDVQAAAQHKNPRTSLLYVNKLPMLLAHDHKMREFKQWLETLVTINLEDVPAKLGISAEQYSIRKQEILGSRFGGIYCRDPLSGIQPGTKVGEVCGEFSKCLTCSNNRHLFVATESNTIHLLQWNEALIKAQEEGVVDFEKNTDWLFWFLFIETVISKLKNGGARHSAILAGAKQIVKERDNHYLSIILKGDL